MSLFAGNDWLRSALDLVTNTGSSAGAAIAVASVAAITGANSTGQWNVAKRVSITIAVSSASSQAPIQFFLFNSSNSAGTALAGWVLSPQNATVGASFAAAGVNFLKQDNLHIATPTAGQALCLSGVANAGAGSVVTLNLQSYVLGKQPVAVSTLS